MVLLARFPDNSDSYWIVPSLFYPQCAQSPVEEKRGAHGQGRFAHFYLWNHLIDSLILVVI